MAIDWNRRVVPRWRESRLSSLLPESLPIGKTILPRDEFANSINLEEKVNAWRKDQDFGVAVDLINYGHISKFAELLKDPARFLVEGEFVLPEHLRLTIERLLGNGQKVQDVNQLEDMLYENLKGKAAELKSRIVIDPRNSIAQVDLARMYAAQGQNKKAKNTILKAVQLQPNHRFVLRSLSRFLAHNQNFEEALFYLNKSEAITKDPWLIATHISLETILEKTPRLLKRGGAILESRSLRPSQYTELASSIATFQAFSGDIKKAKKQFNLSLISPNDNVVAQAIWATHKFGMTINMKDEWLLNPFSHEARYYQYLANADFENAITEAKDWFYDEPFASRPMRAAAYICCVLGHYELAEKYSLRALRVDKDDLEIANNYVYALAAQGKLQKATERLIEIAKAERSLNGTNEGHTLANWGLIQFKSGNFEEGERYYRYAIDVFKSKKDFRAYAQASAYLAREAMLSRNPKADVFLGEALQIIKKHPNKTAFKILEMSKLIEAVPVGKAQKNVAKWTYDPDKRLLLIDHPEPFK